MMSDPTDLQSNVRTETVLVTGANRGLGLEFCRQFLHRKCRVLACCRNPSQANQLSAVANNDRLLTLFSLDVSSETSIRNLAQVIHAEQHQIDVLINNAGICLEDAFGNWSQQVFLDHFLVNTIGPALVTQAVAPSLADQAKVVFISSGMGSLTLNPNPDGPYDSYSVSKLALSMLCQRLASRPQKHSRIFVNLSPGWVRTDMGGQQAPVEAPEAVAAMISVIDRLDADSNGAFLDPQGERIPW